MNMFVRLRQHFGITNYSLGSFIGASEHKMRSLVVGRRGPSLKQIQAFIKLEQALFLDKPLEELKHAQDFLVEQTRSQREKLPRAIRKAEYKLVRQQEALEDLTQVRDRWLRGIHACTHLLATNELTSHERDWLTLHHGHLVYRLKEKLAKMNRLEEKIAGLEAELEVLRSRE